MIDKKRQLRNKRYYESHKDKFREHNKKYYQTHKDYFREYQHSAKYRQYKHNYYLKHKHLGDITSELLYNLNPKSKNYAKLLHKEAERIRNYGK